MARYVEGAEVIAKFVCKVAGEPPIIFGDGEQTRDFIHVKDVVEFVEVVISRGEVGVFNVGTGRAVSIKELAKLVIKLAGLDIEPIYAPPRVGDIRHSVADIRKALSLGWRPKVSLEEGLLELLKGVVC